MSESRKKVTDDDKLKEKLIVVGVETAIGLSHRKKALFGCQPTQPGVGGSSTRGWRPRKH